MRSEAYYEMKVRHTQEEYKLAENEYTYEIDMWPTFIKFWFFIAAELRYKRALSERDNAIRKHKMLKLKQEIRAVKREQI